MGSLPYGTNLIGEVIISGGAPGVTQVTGQVAIVTTGTAVQFPTHTLNNGLLITAHGSNVASIVVGGAGVTNTLNGSGSGYELTAGATTSAAVSNSNTIYINGSSGDWVSFIGS